MRSIHFPVIDPAATGRNIMRLRLERGLTVRDLQMFFGFEEPQAIYKWQSGKSLPTVDNLYALSVLLNVRIDEILIAAKPKLNIAETEPQAETCGSVIFIAHFAPPVIELLVESLYESIIVSILRIITVQNESFFSRYGDHTLQFLQFSHILYFGIL